MSRCIASPWSRTMTSTAARAALARLCSVRILCIPVRIQLNHPTTTGTIRRHKRWRIPFILSKIANGCSESYIGFQITNIIFAMDTITPAACLLWVLNLVCRTEGISIVIAVATISGVGKELVWIRVIADWPVTAICTRKSFLFATKTTVGV